MRVVRQLIAKKKRNSCSDGETNRYNDYEKTATKPPMVIADLEVVELNFRGAYSGSLGDTCRALHGFRTNGAC